MLQESPVEIIETCEESSNWYSRLLRSLVLSRSFEMRWRQQRLFINLHQVSHHGSLDDFTCFLASDTDFCSFIFHGFSRIDLGSSMHNGYSRTCSFMRRRSSHPTLDVARIICRDHWNLSGILQLIFKALPSVSCTFETLQGAERSLHQVSPVAVSVVSHSHSFLLQTIACFPPLIDLLSSTSSGYLGTCSFMRWNSSYSTRCCKNHSWRLLKLVRNPPIDVRGSSFEFPLQKGVTCVLYRMVSGADM